MDIQDLSRVFKAYSMVVKPTLRLETVWVVMNTPLQIKLSWYIWIVKRRGKRVDREQLAILK